jgi:hypothetical protein
MPSMLTCLSSRTRHGQFKVESVPCHAVTPHVSDSYQTSVHNRTFPSCVFFLGEETCPFLCWIVGVGT